MPDTDPSQAPVSGWRAGVLPGWGLVLGLVVFVVGGLGLASLGGVGIALAAVLEALAIYLLHTWGAATVPGD